MGGASYIHTLIASVPTAANAQYYAEIVKEHAIMRRLIEAGTKIAQLGYANETEVDTLVDQAQAEIYAVTDGNAKEDYVSSLMRWRRPSMRLMRTRTAPMACTVCRLTLLSLMS